MIRREFLGAGTALAATRVCAPLTANARGGSGKEWSADEFHRARRFLDTEFGRIAYVERGHGPVAFFLHGWPLNGFQWRGAMARVEGTRRSIAVDLMGLGYSDVPADADLSPGRQADMLAAVMNALGTTAVDIVANDSATAIAQLLAVRYPRRIRSLLLTNGDVHTNSPPDALAPVLDMARRGDLVKAFDRQLVDVRKATDPADGAPWGLAYTNPSFLTAELLEVYLRPLVSGAKRRAQGQGYGIAFEPNPLTAIEQRLRTCPVPVRIVWGTGDPLFPVVWADWLDRTLPNSRGVRRVEGANLFFPEEMPDVIAVEARDLWTSVH